MNDRDMTNGVLFEVQGLTKLYPEGQVRALSNVSLAIHRGEFSAIMGRSGSGKSTLLNMLYDSLPTITGCINKLIS